MTTAIQNTACRLGVTTLTVLFLLGAGSRASAQEASATSPSNGGSAPIAMSTAEDPILMDYSATMNMADESYPVPSEPYLPQMNLDLNASLPRVFAPNMLGDFLGVLYFGDSPGADNNAIRNIKQSATLRTVTRYKAADNRSPRPQNRLWYSLNTFDDAFMSGIDVTRNTLGAELMLGPDFSFEILGPINSFTDGIPELPDTLYGDMRLIAKGLLYETASGVVSAGVAVSFPTAKRQIGVPGGLMYASPFIGYIYSPPGKNWFIQGFQQLDVPFRGEDQGLMHTDVGMGYWMFRQTPDGAPLWRYVSGVAPTVEFHGYTPVFGPPTDELEGLIYNDVLNMTLGTTFMLLNDAASFALGFGLPLTDRRDYNFEFMTHLNWRF